MLFISKIRLWAGLAGLYILLSAPTYAADTSDSLRALLRACKNAYRGGPESISPTQLRANDPEAAVPLNTLYQRLASRVARQNLNEFLKNSDPKGVEDLSVFIDTFQGTVGVLDSLTDILEKKTDPTAISRELAKFQNRFLTSESRTREEVIRYNKHFAKTTANKLNRFNVVIQMRMNNRGFLGAGADANRTESFPYLLRMERGVLNPHIFEVGCSSYNDGPPAKLEDAQSVAIQDFILRSVDPLVTDPTRFRVRPLEVIDPTSSLGVPSKKSPVDVSADSPQTRKVYRVWLENQVAILQSMAALSKSPTIAMEALDEKIIKMVRDNVNLQEVQTRISELMELEALKPGTAEANVSARAANITSYNMAQTALLLRLIESEDQQGKLLEYSYGRTLELSFVVNEDGRIAYFGEDAHRFVKIKGDQLVRVWITQNNQGRWDFDSQRDESVFQMRKTGGYNNLVQQLQAAKKVLNRSSEK